MKPRVIIICLGLFCAIGFILRVVYPFNSVYGLGFINFLETDAWNRMDYARQLAAMPFLTSISFTIHNNLLFSFIVACLSKLMDIEQAGVWVVPVIAVATIITVYFLGSVLFNTEVGLLSALFLAVIPSEYLHRSLLGFSDHHALEVLLMALFVLFVVKAIKHDKWFNVWTVSTGLILFLYILNWASGAYLSIGLLILCCIGLIIYNRFTKQTWHRELPSFLLPVVLALAVYIPLGGYERFMFLFPGNDAVVAVTTTKEIVDTVFTPLPDRTISEIMPLLAPQGTFSLTVVITNLHLFALGFVIGCGVLYKYRHDKAIVIMAVWTLVMLIITLNQRRFLYYMTLNVVILSALVAIEMGKRIKGKALQNAMILALPLILISLPMDKDVAEKHPYLMDLAWHDALVWLREQPVPGMVTAWGDYGHWIKYISGKSPSYMPGPGGDLVAKLFLSTDDNKAKELLEELGTRYLIIDQRTLNEHYFVLVYYSGYKGNRDNTLAYQMGYQGKVPSYLKLLYANQELKIYSSIK